MIRDLRRPIVLVVVSALILAAHAILLRATAEGHAAHALLGAGNAPPPLGPALLAVSLVVVRLLAIVVVPGALLAAAAEIAARFIVGPKASARAHSVRMVDATFVAAGEKHR